MSMLLLLFIMVEQLERLHCRVVTMLLLDGCVLRGLSDSMRISV